MTAFPHHPWSEAGVFDLLNEAGDVLLIAARCQGVPYRSKKREVLDALSSPVCLQFVGWDAPYLFRIRLEEDPVEAISYCGDKLAYVHFNDTDGVNDDHLALTDGIMDNDLITRILDRLKSVQYRRPLGVESNPALPDPIGSAIKTRNVLIENGACE